MAPDGDGRRPGARRVVRGLAPPGGRQRHPDPRRPAGARRGDPARRVGRARRGPRPDRQRPAGAAVRPPGADRRRTRAPLPRDRRPDLRRLHPPARACGRYAARLALVPAPTDGTRRERLTAYTQAIAGAFEAIVADAPEQWWGAFHPIWPDLVAGDAGSRAARAGGAVTAEEPGRGRADLHVHTLASDGTASVADILDALAAPGTLDVVAIADHERIDAAQAARHIALDRGLPVEIVVGEEITTRGGHLLGLFLERRVPPLKSLRWSIEAVHDQGGIAIPAHPLVPLHLSAQGWVLRGAPDRRQSPRAPRRDRDVQPHRDRPLRPRARASRSPPSTACPARQQRRPRRSRRSAPRGRPTRGGPRTTCAGRDPRRRDRRTTGLPRLGGAARGVRAPAAQARPRRPRRGRRPDPARRHRPRPRLSRRAPAGRRASTPATGPAGEDRARLAVRLPAPGRRDPARPLPVREPPPARPHRPDPHLVPRPPAGLRGRRHPPRQGVLDAGQRVGRDGDRLAPLRVPGPGAAGARAVRRPPLPRAVRAVPVARDPARVAERQRRARSTRTAAGRPPTSSAAGR